MVQSIHSDNGAQVQFRGTWTLHVLYIFHLATTVQLEISYFLLHYIYLTTRQIRVRTVKLL